jgi:NSS family neurotransmitter:Na+ symporter
MMPAISMATCILIGWLMTPDTIIDEVTKNGERFIRKKLYRVMVRFVAPVLLVILLLKAIGIMR